MTPAPHRRRFIDWTLPPGRTDWLVGTGATGGERLAVWVTVAVALPAAVASGLDTGTWSWWHHLLVAVLVVDVVGGVVANGLGSAKRLYHGPVAPPGPAARFLRHDLVFAAAHLPHLALAALVPGATLAWVGLWYAVVLVGVAAVRRSPQHLTRPVALGVTAVAAVVAPLAPSPDGLAWFGPVLVLKLVLAHAVPEEPYRPAPPEPDPAPPARVDGLPIPW